MKLQVINFEGLKNFKYNEHLAYLGVTLWIERLLIGKKKKYAKTKTRTNIMQKLSDTT